MSTGKVGGGSSAPRPAPAPKPAAPKPAASAPAKSSTSAAKPATSSSGTTGTSTSSTGASSSAKSSTTGSTSTTDKSKSTDTSSTSSTTKDGDKSSDSSSSNTTSTEDKFEKSQEAKAEDAKKEKGSFNDRFIDNLRKSYEPESTEIKDKVGQVEQQLAKDNFSAADGKDAIKKLESTSAELKDGSRKDKLEARVAELKKEVTERERAEDKAKAAQARDASDPNKAGAQNEDSEKVHEAGGVEGDVKSNLKDQRQRLTQTKESEAPGAKPSKDVARAGENDPETQQIAKQRQLNEAEQEARQRLSDFRENNNQEAMANVQRAYDTALANRDQTIQSLQQELSGYYPADKAGELAKQALTSKENFYSSFDSLHSIGNKNSQERLSKLNPEAAKLVSQENSVSGAGPEEQLGRMREGMQTRALGPTDEAIQAVPKDAVSQLESSVADMADVRESELRGRVRDLKDANEAREQKSKGVGEQDEDKAKRLEDKEKTLGGAAAADSSVRGSDEGGQDGKKTDDVKVVAAKGDKADKAVGAQTEDASKTDKEVADKDDKAVGTVAKEPAQAEQETAAKGEPDEKDVAIDRKTQQASKAEENLAAKNDQDIKTVGSESEQAPRADKEVAAKDDQGVKTVGAEARGTSKSDKDLAAKGDKDVKAVGIEAKVKAENPTEEGQDLKSVDSQSKNISKADKAAVKNDNDPKAVGAETKGASKTGEEVADKNNKDPKAVGAETEGASKTDKEVADKDIKAVGAESKQAPRADKEVAAKDDQDVKTAGPQAKETSRADKDLAALGDKDIKAVGDEVKKPAKADRGDAPQESQEVKTQEIKSAYDAAIADREKTLKGLEKELSGYYPAEKAGELAQQAVASKEDFYAHYGALHSVGDQSTRDNLAKLNPAAAKLFGSKPKSPGLQSEGGPQSARVAEKSDLTKQAKPTTATDEGADTVPRQATVSPRDQGRPQELRTQSDNVIANKLETRGPDKKTQAAKGPKEQGEVAPDKVDQAMQKKLETKNLDQKVQSDDGGSAISRIKGSERAAPGSDKNEVGSEKAAPGSKENELGSEKTVPGSKENELGSEKTVPGSKENELGSEKGIEGTEKAEKGSENTSKDSENTAVDSEQTAETGQLSQAGADSVEAIGQALGGAVAEGSKLISKATDAVTSKISDAVGGLFGGKKEGEATGDSAKKGGSPEGGAATSEGAKSAAAGEGAAEPAAGTAENKEESTEDLTDGQRQLRASQEAARTRLDEYRESGDTEALESIDKAYERAQANPEKTKETLEKELAKVYPEDQAKEMADKALESKEDFYSQYSSLQRNAKDEESKGALEKVNPEAAALAAREQEQALPSAATQTTNEQVQTVSTAIQKSFQERATNDSVNFERQLREAYPEADDKKIGDLMDQARNGEFPVPEDIKFVPKDELGSQSGRYDADEKQLILSEDLKHNPAALQRAMLEGTASHLDQQMGVEKGLLSGFNLSGEKELHGAKLISQVRDDVAAGSSDEAVARAKGYEQVTADPGKAQEAIQSELEKRFEAKGFSGRRAERRAREIAEFAVQNAESYDAVFNRMYEKGDPAARERLKEMNPTMAALAESRLNTPREEQGLAVQETGAGTAFERYRDAKSEGPHLDPLADVSKGFARATRDDGKPTIDALQKMYEDRGLPPERALQKAQEAVASEKGLYSQFSALYKTADEEGQAKLRELNPELAGLIEREKAGTLKTDDQWRQDVKDSYDNVPLIGGWMADNAIKKVEAKLTTTSQTDEQRSLASAFQGAIKDRATSDPEKFAQDLRTAFPKAEQSTIDGLVQLAKDGNFPLAQKVNFVDKDDPLLNGENASYDSQSKNIYIDKELLKDPAKVLSAYVEENGHHLDSILGGGDSAGDEGELLEKSVLKSGGISFLDKSRAKLEDDFEIVIGDDGVVRVIENQAGPGPVIPGPVTPGPVTPGPVTPGPGPGPIAGPVTPTPGPVTPTPGPVTPTPGPVNPTPGPVTPTPGPVTPRPGPVTPGPSPVTGPVTPQRPVNPSPIQSQPVTPPSAPPVRPTPDPTAPKLSPVEPSRDDWKPARNLRAPDAPSQTAEANQQKEFKANFDPSDIRNLDELKRLDEAMAKLKDLPQALDQLDKVKEALKGGKGLSESLSDLKNLTQTMDNLKGLAGNLDSLERLGKLQHQLKDLPQKLANMETLPSALETLGNLNKSMADLQKLPKMLDQLRDLPRQMAQLEQLPNTLNRFNKLPDNVNDLGKLSGFLDAAREVPGKQIKTNGARAVAADRILSGKIVGTKGVVGTKTGPKVTTRGQTVGPSPTETGGKSARIAGGGSTVPYVGRFGGTAPGLGPSIGRDASRQTQSRPASGLASKAVSKTGGLGRAGGIGGFGKGVAQAGAGGPKAGPSTPVGPKAAPTGPNVGGPNAAPSGPGVGGANVGLPRTGPTSPSVGGPKTGFINPGVATPGAAPSNPGAGVSKPFVGSPLKGKSGVGPSVVQPAAGRSAFAAGPAEAKFSAAKSAPTLVPAAEYQQLSQRMNAAGDRAGSDSLSRLQNVLTGTDGTRQLPGVLKSLEHLPKSMSSVGRLNGLLGKKDGLAKGIAGLNGLAEVARTSSKTMKNLDGLSSLLRSVQDSPDAYKGLKRMPGLINHMGGIKGDNNPEAMSRLLKTVQNRPDALEGLKTFQNLMSTLQKPEMARSLDQLNKMVQSGHLDKLAQSGQKLATDLQKPQAVFGMDKLESLFFKAKSSPDAMKGLDRLGQVLGGRDRQGAAIGVDRLGSLLQTAKSQPTMMRQIVERVVQPSPAQVASQGTSGKATIGAAAAGATTGPTTGPAGFEAGAALNSRSGADRRASDRRSGDRRIGAAGRVGATSNAASAGSAGAAKSPGRLRDYRQIFNMLSEVGQGVPAASEHPAKLAQMSKGTQGSHAVADAMEAQVVAKPERMLDTLKGMTKTSESRQAFGKTLSNMAEATPERLVGILLLTSDVAGGRQAVANMFGQLAADPQSSGSLGKMIGASTRTETGAAGMKDLLTNMMAADDNGDYTQATKTAQTFADASRTRAGARGLAEGLTNLTTLSGGARDVGGMVRQMSRTNDGARATGEMLMNMAGDRQGAKDLGKVLARASKSTAGGRDLLASFNKIAQTDAGRNDVSRLMVRLTESQHGAKMLSHMARDSGNAKSLAGLLNQVAQSPQAAVRMNFALERALHNPQARADMQVFRGRMASDVGLREAVDKLTTAPHQSQPLQLSQAVKGADALARLTAFENLARSVGERPLEPQVRTVEAAGNTSSGGTTDSQNPSQQQNPENRPFPNQAQPYPDLAAVSDVWRNQSLKPEGGERLAEQAQGAAAAEGEDSRTHSDREKSAFRPGDVYSDLTLLRARICGDCGFRTNAMGKCARCGFNLLQEQPRISPV